MSELYCMTLEKHRYNSHHPVFELHCAVQMPKLYNILYDLGEASSQLLSPSVRSPGMKVDRI